MKSITLYSSVIEPIIQVLPSKILILTPTTINSVGSKAFFLENESKENLDFAFKFLNESSEILSVVPSVGSLYPLEKKKFQLLFQPTEKKMNVFTITVEYSLAGTTNIGKKYETKITVGAEGLEVNVKAKTEIMHFENIPLHKPRKLKSNEVELFNDSNCTVRLFCRILQLCNNSYGTARNSKIEITNC